MVDLMNGGGRLDTVAELRVLLGGVLQLGTRATHLDGDSALLGAIPELDSMAVVSLLAAVEEHFGIVIEDDEISAETLATVGTFSTFISRKLRD